MTGSFSNISMYTMHGSDQVIIRTKGGPSKKQIKTAPQFEGLRRNNSEWAGCTKMGSDIRNSFFAMKRLEDYPVTGSLNSICKQIQKADTVNELGKRGVYLSRHKEMLVGFCFSKKQVLESVLRVPIKTTLDREKGEAQVDIQAINADMYLYNFRKLPYFRIIGVIGGVCDKTYIADENKYDNLHDNYYDEQNGVYESEWMPTMGVLPALSFTLHYPLVDNPIPDDVTIILSVGIEFGQVSYDGKPVGVKYAGCGKVMMVG